ncbi:MAG: 5-formyltetrahydrofolate cyclo-ligase [Chitinophagaceae bacterium]|nr:5-formyltetrahydrofolate cyclo-ligase [Chitinophagaceae bacterium]
MTKKEIRSLYRIKREALGEAETAKLQDLVLIQFQHLHLPFLEYVHTYLPAEEKKEVHPGPMVRFLEFHNPGLKVIVPRTVFETVSLQHFIYNEHSILKKNQYGILEPINGVEVSADLPDLVFVPLLAFDKQGHRVGYGKGFYDRFLAGCRPDTLKVGLSFFEPVDRITDTNNFDVPLDYCITPYSLYEF